MKCRICNRTGEGNHFVAREMFFGLRTEHEYYMCPSCGCLQIVKAPLDMSPYYDSSYYSLKRSSNSYIRNMLLSVRNKYAIWGSSFPGRLVSMIFPTDQFFFLEPIKDIISLDSRILDVGCGSGKLLMGLKRAGFKRLLGIDPFIESDVREDGEVLVKKLEIFALDGVFDLVMFHHSFEHIEDPAAVLSHARKLLSRDGICVIRIPVVSSFAWNRYGINWVQLDAPRHFYLHSLESMSQIANRTGFRMEKVVFDSNSFQFWGSEQYESDIPLMDDRSYAVNPRKSIFSRTDIAVFEEKAKVLNRRQYGDQAIFYLYRLG